MTPRKTRSRRPGSHAQSSLHYDSSHGQQNPAFQPSDYESDTQFMMADQPPPTVVPSTLARTVDDVNLSVLRRYNAAISSILSKASYAVVYTFSPSTSSWEKSGVEGTMFICQLSPGTLGEDRYNVIILNRRGLNNFEAQLLDENDVEITDEYVILNVREDESATDQAQKVYGLWIFCEPPPSSTADARIENANKIKECAAFAGHSKQQALATIAQQHQYMDGPSNDLATRFGQQVGLQDQFGDQRPQGTPQSMFSYNQQPTQGPIYPGNGPRQAQQGPQPVQAQNDVLGDLFRRAGLGAR